jgi:hypothetical protein
VAGRLAADRGKVKKMCVSTRENVRLHKRMNRLPASLAVAMSGPPHQTEFR